MSVINLPIDEKIVEDIIATLGRVSPANGPYHCELKPERPKPTGTVWDDGRCVVFINGRERTEDCPHQYDQWILHVTIRAHVVEDSTSDVSLDTRLSVVAADIYYALRGDVTSRKRDGWALNTVSISGISFLPRLVDANEGDVDVDVDILYRHTIGQPFESPHRS